jgi:N-acetyl-gamma-glutamyl-phosphate reductase
LNEIQRPVVNAVSGVSGAGRKISTKTSFCSVSLQPYNIFNHRHEPEIFIHSGVPIIFIPHIGNFPRGILATITCRLKPGISRDKVAKVFYEAYHDKPLIRIYQTGTPSIKSVINLPFCDIGFSVRGEYIVIISAEDNLLKGAASQAIQCLNIRFGFPETKSLI